MVIGLAQNVLLRAVMNIGTKNFVNFGDSILARKKKTFEDVLKHLKLHQEQFVCSEPTRNGYKVSFVMIGESKGKSGTIMTFATNYSNEKINQLVSNLPSLY